MSARTRGFINGYREAIQGVELDVSHPSTRWMRGHREGREAAHADLRERAAGPFELPYLPLEEHKQIVFEIQAERDQLRQQVEKLLGATDAVLALRRSLKLKGAFGYLPDNPEVRARLRRLKQAADQVRKELEG